MKNILIPMFTVFVVGCSSPPKQPQPSGELMPVYPLQTELNERPHWKLDPAPPFNHNSATKGDTTQPAEGAR